MKTKFACVILLLTLTSFNAISQENNNQQRVREKTINVSGLAEMEVVPDEIYVTVELREYDKKGGGKVDIDGIKNDFIKSALSIGIAETDISVQGYQGWDGNYWLYRKNKKKTPDLKASITYQVKLSSVKKMDELVQRLDDEATQNFFISRVSHSKMQDFKKQLKIQAVKAAKEKAIYLAEAIGEKAGEALTINDPNEITVHPPYPMMANMRMKSETAAMDAGQPESNIDFKKMKLQFEVNAVFALK